MHTVIGAFEDKATAQRALERLTAAGIERRHIHLEHQEVTGTASTQASGEREQGGWSFFKALFGSDDDTRYTETYDEAVRRGSCVLVVDAQTEADADRASGLLSEAGAFDIDERSQHWQASGWTGGRTGTTAPTGTAGTPAKAASPGATGTPSNTGSVKGQTVANVVEEELRVGKRTVDRGGVRVIQRVSQKPVHEVVRLREERAVVDRQRVDRPATEADLSNFRKGSVEVRETIEEPVVSKQARVVEEVRIGKEVREREQAIDETVRRKDVDVQRVEGDGRLARDAAVAADGRKIDPTLDKPRRG